HGSLRNGQGAGRGPAALAGRRADPGASGVAGPADGEMASAPSPTRGGGVRSVCVGPRRLGHKHGTDLGGAVTYRCRSEGCGGQARVGGKTRSRGKGAGSQGEGPEEPRRGQLAGRTEPGRELRGTPPTHQR